MKKMLSLIVVIFGFFLLFGVEVDAATIKGTCIKVADGDTLHIRAVRRILEIRLAGADCPEEGQDYYQEAKEFTTSLVLKKKVAIEVGSFEGEKQLIGRVYVGGTDLSLALVDQGLAWYDKESGTDKALAKAQKKARKNKMGLWSNPNPMAPWIFRKTKEPQ